LSDADRKRLIAILGMLGSNSAGERDNAARLAEQFRRQQGMTWEEMFAEPVIIERIEERIVEKTVYVDRPVYHSPPKLWSFWASPEEREARRQKREAARERRRIEFEMRTINRLYPPR
jgi:hypothetical protein